MSTPVVKEKTKPGWDKRAWRVAIALSAVIGILEAALWDRTLQRWVNHTAASELGALSLILSLFVFPSILSGIARRRTLLWAYLPLAAFFAICIPLILLPQPPDTDVGPDPTARQAIGLVAVLLLAPLITAGPVCLFRLLRRRAKERRIANAAAIHEAMAIRREGVWPPPPAAG